MLYTGAILVIKEIFQISLNFIKKSKKSKTKVNPLITEIIGIPFWYYGIGPRGRLGQHIRVTEMDYVNFKK